MSSPVIPAILDPDLDVEELQVALERRTALRCPCMKLAEAKRDGRICMLCANTRVLTICAKCDGAGLTVQLGTPATALGAACRWCGGRGVCPVVVV